MGGQIKSTKRKKNKNKANYQTNPQGYYEKENK